ncbi:MAG: type II toxin-antitoxin system death-on-curing family toxin [archaeon]|nr:type II toxin-antitoxin system death-on-curing family toxin [archaeon]
MDDCKQNDGDLFDKAVILLKGIIKGHPFASGNRRTAFIAMKYFLITNNHKIGIDDNPENAKIMLGIREGYYSDNEIKEWIKNGKIRQFKR